MVHLHMSWSGGLWGLWVLRNKIQWSQSSVSGKWFQITKWNLLGGTLALLLSADWGGLCCWRFWGRWGEEGEGDRSFGWGSSSRSWISSIWDRWLPNSFFLSAPLWTKPGHWESTITGSTVVWLWFWVSIAFFSGYTMSYCGWAVILLSFDCGSEFLLILLLLGCIGSAGSTGFTCLVLRATGCRFCYDSKHWSKNTYSSHQNQDHESPKPLRTASS